MVFTRLTQNVRELGYMLTPTTQEVTYRLRRDSFLKGPFEMNDAFLVRSVFFVLGRLVFCHHRFFFFLKLTRGKSVYVERP